MSRRGAIALFLAAAAVLAVLSWLTRGQYSVDQCLDQGGAVLTLDGRQVCNTSFHNMFDATPLRPTWATVGMVLSGVTAAVMLGLLLFARSAPEDEA